MSPIATLECSHGQKCRVRLRIAYVSQVITAKIISADGLLEGNHQL